MLRILLLIILTTILETLMIAQIPRTLSYQGVLMDSAGLVKQNGHYTFTFRLYATPNGGTELWHEMKTLPVNAGLFSTSLGDFVHFPDSVKFDKPYWLGIQPLGSAQELSPRVPLTSVGSSIHSITADQALVSVRSLKADSAQHSLNADTATVSLQYVNDSWTTDRWNIYRLGGNIGIYTKNPMWPLDIAGTVNLHFARSLRFDVGDMGDYSIFSDAYFDQPNNKYLFIHSPYYHYGGGIVMDSVGRVSIGKLPTDAMLDVAGRLRSNNLEVTSSIRTMTIDVIGDPTLPSTYWLLHVNGITSTKVLQITGGSDLAEPFEMSCEETLEPGSVVIIDEEHPGQLKLSDRAYDRRVAGVISGAGGIKPGLTLNQTELTKTGQNVALSGRVYVKASASNGAISPGDLLTTSDIPGFAMRASDEKTKPGMTIGKAMSSLKVGEGLVLVLVNLQ